MDRRFGDELAASAFGFFFIVGFFAFVAAAWIATAICWWFW